MTNKSFINRSILLIKNIHTVEIRNIDVFYASFTFSPKIQFIRQFDCHWLKFEGVCDSQLGNKNSSVAI